MQAGFIYPAHEAATIPHLDRVGRTVAVHAPRALAGHLVGFEIGLLYRPHMVAMIEEYDFVTGHVRYRGNEDFVPFD